METRMETKVTHNTGNREWNSMAWLERNNILESREYRLVG
jgi:hypothetical protein